VLVWEYLKVHGIYIVLDIHSPAPALCSVLARVAFTLDSIPPDAFRLRRAPFGMDPSNYGHHVVRLRRLQWGASETITTPLAKLRGAPNRYVTLGEPPSDTQTTPARLATHISPFVCVLSPPRIHALDAVPVFVACRPYCTF